MLLQFWGYPYTIDELIAEFLPMRELTVNSEGYLVGTSPEEAFIGSPYRSDSYGCYAPVIYRMLDEVVEWYHSVENVTGMTLDQICQKYLDKGMPVLCWVTINMNPSYAGDSWMLEDGSGWFTWKAQEHCMVLIGYDSEYYYFNDPYNSNQTVQWGRQLVETRYEELGRQAVVII